MLADGLVLELGEIEAEADELGLILALAELDGDVDALGEMEALGEIEALALLDGRY